HSLPRMLQRPAPSPSLARGIFALVLAGLLLGLVAQPLAARPGFSLLFPAAMALQCAGVTLFAGYLVRTVSWPAQPSLGFILAGTLWFWMGALARLWLSMAAVQSGSAVPPAAGNAAYLHAMTWGFLLAYVLGYSLRLLPAFVGLPAGSASWAWSALL